MTVQVEAPPPAAGSAEPEGPTAAHRRVGLGAVAAAWSAVAGLGIVAAVVLVSWLAAGMVEPHTDALALAVHGWLAGVGASVAVPGGRISLLPLGLTLVQALLVYRSAAKAADVAGPGGLRGGVVLGCSVTLVFGGLAALAAALARPPLSSVEPAEAFARAALLAGAAGAAGILCAPEQGRALRGALADRLPTAVREALPVVVPAAVAGVAGLVVLSSGLVTVWLVGSFGQVSEVVAALAPGLVGSVALLAVSVLMLPTLVVWAMSYLLGVGFAVGKGTTVSLRAVDLETLPGLPVLAAVPTAPSSLGPLLLAAPWVAGVLAAALAHRRAPHGCSVWLRLAYALAVSVLAGVLVAMIAQLAAGAMGPGRLDVVGSTAWQVGLAMAGPVLVVGVLGAVVPSLRGAWQRRRRPAEQEAQPARED